ncbi:MAG: GFA family protein [Sphingobium sp.]
MSGDLPLTGSCNCGKVRYELHAQPFIVAACHCANCRKQSGAAHSVNLAMAAKAVTITGDLSSYEDHGEDSGQPVLREFCGHCGSPIRSTPAATPKMVAIKAGTLDDPNPYPPTVHIWTSSAVSWANIPADAPRFEKGPPAK